MSERKTLANRHIPGFFLTNFTLFNQNVLKGLEISASVYNLFDTRYGDPGGEEHRQDVIPQDGRSFRIKLTYGF
jgi:iron complex outermembrane receptor protein